MGSVTTLHPDHLRGLNSIRERWLVESGLLNAIPPAPHTHAAFSVGTSLTLRPIRFRPNTSPVG